MDTQRKGHPQQMTLEEIAQKLNCPFEGNGNTKIWGFNSLEKAREGELVFLSHHKYRPLLEKTKASAAVIPQDEKFDRIPVLKSKNPHMTFIRAIEFFYESYLPPREFHPTAQISSSAKIGKDVAIGAFCYIGEEVEIGAGTTIFPLVSIYPWVKIGKHTVIHSGVSIREGIQIGNKVIIHNSSVIGSDGFGYLQDKNDSPIKIPQTGTVIIEDNVEIGANTAIDRAALGETIIRKGTKIDNLVQVGHNVEIGENSLLAGQAGISGSTKLGKKVIMAGQSGVADHINIGDNVTMAAQAGIMKDIPANSIVAGTPQRDIKEFMKIMASLSRLPELIKTVKKLEVKIKELEKSINKE
jgi:UDP-3-O-[3-hydroxymyristoyl] glucosamine N-acyltransferase